MQKRAQPGSSSDASSAFVNRKVTVAKPQRHVRPAHKVAMRAVPARRTLVLLETGLILGLAEGLMWNAVTQLELSQYVKALILMVGVIGVFALAVRILEPLIQSSLKAVSKLDAGGGALMRIGLHAIILFLIYAGYVRTFFPQK